MSCISIDAAVGANLDEHDPVLSSADMQCFSYWLNTSEMASDLGMSSMCLFCRIASTIKSQTLSDCNIGVISLDVQIGWCSRGNEETYLVPTPANMPVLMKLGQTTVVLTPVFLSEYNSCLNNNRSFSLESSQIGYFTLRLHVNQQQRISMSNNRLDL